jgi:hypothetical protein
VFGEDVVVQQALPRTDAVGVQLALTEPVEHLLQRDGGQKHIRQSSYVGSAMCCVLATDAHDVSTPTLSLPNQPQMPCASP